MKNLIAPHLKFQERIEAAVVLWELYYGLREAASWFASGMEKIFGPMIDLHQ
jgi:hypothetical protein